jgi:ubiquinone/menaquinone biosynthesis C-methylase UbiE
MAEEEGMSKRLKRVSVIGVLVLVGITAFVLGSMPYLPVVHGSDADEVEYLVEWLGIESGAHVADLGAGDGRFAMALAERVGSSGQVYATEISTERLDEMRGAAAEAGLDNVSVIAGGVSSTGLPDACCDAIFSRNVYHHLTEPAAINRDIRRALRQGGRLLVIDFEPGGPMDRFCPSDTEERRGGHGTPTATVIDEVTAAGFHLMRGPEAWRGRMYAVMFEAENGPDG